MVDTLLQIVGPEAEIGDWARVAAAVDKINKGGCVNPTRGIIVNKMLM